jgi:outer membrane protein assembly factor BamD (BamD/ComL family)
VKEETKVKKMTKAGKTDSKEDSTIVIDSTKIKDQLDRRITQQKMVDSLYRSIIRTKFELGGLFYVEIQQPDSALRLFNEVVNKYSASEFAPRALYSIAEIQRSIKQKPKSELDSLYTKIITSYPESPYANEARKSLGLPLVEAQKDSAQEEFEQAEKLSESKKYESAIVLYKRVSDQFLTSTVSAKSLFTAGWHYENSLMNNDSAYAVYKRVITKYPLSQFANVARPKVTEYENELKRIEQEKQKIIEEQKLKEEQEKEAKSPKTPKTEIAPQDSLPTPKNKL